MHKASNKIHTGSSVVWHLRMTPFSRRIFMEITLPTKIDNLRNTINSSQIVSYLLLFVEWHHCHVPLWIQLFGKDITCKPGIYYLCHISGNLSRCHCLFMLGCSIKKYGCIKGCLIFICCSHNRHPYRMDLDE